jgi:hypothetical protein
MNDKIVPHPHRDLMAETKHEREVAESAEAQALQDAIFKALNAYSDFLDSHGLIWEDTSDPNGRILQLYCAPAGTLADTTSLRYPSWIEETV